VKVTKYPQSCLIIEQNGKRLLIDPGSFVAEKYHPNELSPYEAILITHEHPDHASPDLLRALVQKRAVPVVANKSAAKVLGKVVTKVVEDGESFRLADMQIVARELAHCLLPDGSPGPQNTGYVVEGTFFHPGDGIAIEGLQVSAAAIPIAGPDISPRDAFKFIKQLECRTVIPIHYDFFIEDQKVIEQFALSVVPSVKFIALASGQSIEL
jgi:L-ascorbate metabolism protein UlaG (beta-lactamase superfamily)